LYSFNSEQEPGPYYHQRSYSMSLPLPPPNCDPIVVESTAAVTDSTESGSPVARFQSYPLEAIQYDDNDEDSDYPEGGTEAWLVVLGAWCAMIPRYETSFTGNCELGD
jgi:hypothetical protein